jgi:hypothetical protein
VPVALHPALLSDNEVTVRAGTGGAVCLWHFTLAFTMKMELGVRFVYEALRYYAVIVYNSIISGGDIPCAEFAAI